MSGLIPMYSLIPMSGLIPMYKKGARQKEQDKRTWQKPETGNQKN